MKPPRKDGAGEKSSQLPNHPQPKPSPVQSAGGAAPQESDSTATNEHARTDHQPSLNPRLRGMSHHLVQGHLQIVQTCLIMPMRFGHCKTLDL